MYEYVTTPVSNDQYQYRETLSAGKSAAYINGMTPDLSPSSTVPLTQSRRLDPISIVPPYIPVGKRFLSPKETAALLRKSTGTLANWRCLGVGPGWEKFGSRILYPVEHLADYFADNGYEWTVDEVAA